MDEKENANFGKTTRPLPPEVQRAVDIIAMRGVSAKSHWGERALSPLAPDPIIFDERYKRLGEAAAYCAACTVKDECLEDALSTYSDGEFRAGLTTAERRKLKRQRAAR